MYKQFAQYYIPLMAMLLLGSCRKDLCYEEYHPHSRKVMVEVDYSQMDTIPDEMRIDFYSHTSDKHLIRFVSPQKPYVDLPTDTYEAVIFNDNSEYISLRNELDYQTFAAYLAPLTRAQYNAIYGGQPVTGFSDIGPTEKIIGIQISNSSPIDPSAMMVGQPDFFFVDNSDKFVVTDNTTQQEIIQLCPKNQISVYNITTDVTGLEHVLQVRGMLTGVSPGIRFYDRTRDPYTAVVMFDFKKETNRITATVTSFGFKPNTPIGYPDPEKQKLCIEFLLTDNRVYRVYYELNSVQNAEPQNVKTVILESIEIEAPTTGGSGGFDIDIDDWLDEETIPIS